MIQYLGCEAARRMLDAFVDDELPMSAQVEMEGHLRWCDTCRARVEDVRLVGAAVRLGSGGPGAGREEAATLAAMHDEVLARVCAERDLSLSVWCRELFIDARLLWPALGASLALAVCLYAVTAVGSILRAERPDSMAALISFLANPGSDENPLHLGADVLAPRTLDVGPALAWIPEEEAEFAVAAVVTREGRVANYSLLQAVREHVVNRSTPQADRDEVSAIHDTVTHSRFEPAQAHGGVVAVNVVWLLARTTVRASAKPDDPGMLVPGMLVPPTEPELLDADPLSVGLGRPVFRPARS